MKKRYIWIIIVLLAIVMVVLIFSEKSSTFSGRDKDFAIADTGSVTKIFLADMDGNTVLLERSDSSNWTVNGEYTVQPDVMKQFLRTLMYITVRGPVGIAGRDNVIRYMASFGTKVEIYQNKHFIDFWGIKLFKRVKKTITYYVGDNTQDNAGTYMKMEKSDIPFVTYIPGFQGFLHTRYSTNVQDWRDHNVFNFFLKDIESVTMVYPNEPQKSFTIENPDNYNFKLLDIQNNKYISKIDTVRIINYLSGFFDARFERLVNDEGNVLRDSLLGYDPFQVLTVKPRKGNSIQMMTWLKKNELTQEEMEARFFDGSEYPWDRERMWALINDGKDLVTIQYFVFGRILKPIQFFSPEYRDMTTEEFQMMEIK